MKNKKSKRPLFSEAALRRRSEIIGTELQRIINQIELSVLEVNALNVLRFFPCEFTRDRFGKVPDGGTMHHFNQPFSVDEKCLRDDVSLSRLLSANFLKLSDTLLGQLQDAATDDPKRIVLRSGLPQSPLASWGMCEHVISPHDLPIAVYLFLATDFSVLLASFDVVFGVEIKEGA